MLILCRRSGKPLYPGLITLICESWKNPERGTITERVLRQKIQSAALRHLYNIWSCALDIFRNHARWWSQTWHIFLFSAAYFPSYWHMPFEISIIKKPNWHSICTNNFQFQTVTSVMILDFFPKMTRGDGPKNSQIRVKSRALIHLPPESQHERY